MSDRLTNSIYRHYRFLFDCIMEDHPDLVLQNEDDWDDNGKGVTIRGKTIDKVTRHIKSHLTLGDVNGLISYLDKMSIVSNHIVDIPVVLAHNVVDHIIRIEQKTINEN